MTRVNRLKMLNIIVFEFCLIVCLQLESNKPLPVMIWIYGGGYQVGEASRDLYSPDYFMQKDVIVVTFNYRLGVLGEYYL